jgi:hypothetical protein
MQTVTVSVRVPKSEADRWRQVARDVGIDRASLFKQALRTGCASALLDRAASAYRKGEVTLARAAELAGLSLREMQLRMHQIGIELNYDARDLEKDLSV